MISRKIPWKSQPPGAVGSNKTGALASKLSFLFSAQNKFQDRALSKPLSVLGAANSVNSYGNGVKFSGGVGACRFSAGGTFTYGENFAVVWIADTAAVANRVVLGDRDAVAGGLRLFLLNVTANGSFRAEGTTASNASILTFQANTGNGFVDGKPHVFAFVKRGNATHEFYKDGVLFSSTTSTVGYVDNAVNSTFEVGGINTGIPSYDHAETINLLGVFNYYAPTAAEIAELSANPWQLFQPRTQYIPVSATSGPLTHATDGVLAGPGAATAGAAARFRAFASSGDLAGQIGSVVGAAARSTGTVSHDNTGALVGPVAAVVGSAARLHLFDSTGNLIGPGALLSGVSARASLYPDPSVVLAGVQYGPGGIYVGTLTGGLSETRISLRSFTGRF